MSSFGSSQVFIDEVRERNDIVQIVGEYVALRQNGRRYWGLCPFHGEKTPSFSVDADAQLFYCFGCHKGGNVFHIVMHMERMEFWEAVEHLAGRVRLTMPERGGLHGMPRQNKERLLEALSAAAAWYHGILWSGGGSRALEYLRGRGLNDAVIRRFGLGYAPDTWDGAMDALKAKGFTEEELVLAGIINRRESRVYDAFRDRVIFPIMDTKGRVIAFGGRLMGQGNPKYLNSSDTPAFNKRRNLYALNHVEVSGERGDIHLVEGYMDVISLTRCGVKNCVATLGTALTPEQARLLKRYTSAPVICYDGDEAGINATLRALPILAQAGMQPMVKPLPPGVDPDDFIREWGLEAFEGIHNLDGTTFSLDVLKTRKPPEGADTRSAYAIDALRIIRAIPDPVSREPFVERVMIETGYNRDVLMEQMRVKMSNDPGSAQNARQTHTDTNYRNTTLNEHTPPQQDGTDEMERAQRDLLRLLLGGVRLPDGLDAQRLLTHGAYKDMLDAYYAGGLRAVTGWLEGIESEEERSRLTGLLAERLDPGDGALAARMIGECLSTIELSALTREIDEVSRALSDTGGGGDKKALLDKLQALMLKRSQLKTRKE